MNLFSYIQYPTQSPASSDILHMIHFPNVHSAPRYALFWSFSSRISSHISIFLLRRPPSGLFTYKSLSKSPIVGYSARLFGPFPYDPLPKCPFSGSLRSFLELFHKNFFSYIQYPTQSPASSDIFLMIHFLNVHSPPRYASFWSFSPESLLKSPISTTLASLPYLFHKAAKKP